MDALDDILAAQIQEIRRGTIVLACLRQLEEPQYGYSLLAALEKGGFPVSENRPRKYYRVSAEGRVVGQRLLREWEDLRAGLDRLSASGGTGDEHHR